ncbi:DUF4910 domain-containing protein [uncultured Desulfobacter sp.]|uniref:DUF4910 domain-containing protein n=1 Tax=uncultured Desulfobacter sp. TaxID=240139 RepID=UPI002AABB5F2|nr:DUF4910 domain-containing protein [uncultured Desulfobacter sp.]
MSRISINDAQIGQMKKLFRSLWPINRSLAGPGFRKSLDVLSSKMPMERHRFKTNQKIFDWTIPEEWDVKDAWFADSSGKKYAEFKNNNLHLVSHSNPYMGHLPLSELSQHIHTLPGQPDAIPYRTAYYKETWGFCLSYNEFSRLKDGDYQVHIDTTLQPGYIEIGEAVLPGESDQEILFSTYLCHPSMANNELSGPIAMVFLYELLKIQPKRRYTYRFVISAETLGTLCFLSLRGQHLKNKLMAGYVMTCLADRGEFTYKESRKTGTLGDRAAHLVLKGLGRHHLCSFDPGNGSEERQYCSPGFNLPVGSLMRTMYSRFSEYHTSLDNEKFISFVSLKESVEAYAKIAFVLENNFFWWNKVQFGEPQLGARKLYPECGFSDTLEQRTEAMMWLINFSDGEHDLMSIAERSGQDIMLLISVAEELRSKGLFQKCHS